MEDLYRVCEQNQFKNYQPYPYICPSCSNSVDCGDLNCSVCNTKVLFCFQVIISVEQICLCYLPEFSTLDTSYLPTM